VDGFFASVIFLFHYRNAVYKKQEYFTLGGGAHAKIRGAHPALTFERPLPLSTFKETSTLTVDIVCSAYHALRSRSPSEY
jgi:hypothetical protein